MSRKIEEHQAVSIMSAPPIEGLAFRNFRDEEDFEQMVRISDAANVADKIRESTTARDLAHLYAHRKEVNPQKDILFVEIDGQPIAYCSLSLDDEMDGPRVYNSFGFVHPDWRRKGLGTALLAYNEAHLREIAKRHKEERQKVLRVWSADTQKGANTLYEKAGYQPLRYFYLMLRPLDEAIPDAGLPKGLEVRPIAREQFRQIWEAMNEAFRDHWGHTEGTEQDYKRWATHPRRDPGLWKVAWDGDEVAGMVLNEINKEENAKLGVNWGWTDPICVRRPWRRRGLARALILESLATFKALGFSEAALGVDTNNPNGALRLYESCGFQADENWTVYEKALE